MPDVDVFSWSELPELLAAEDLFTVATVPAKLEVVARDEDDDDFEDDEDEDFEDDDEEEDEDGEEDEEWEEVDDDEESED